VDGVSFHVTAGEIDRATIGMGLDALVLVVVGSVFLVLGARAFSKIQI
jgi:hypothetical protein